MLDRERDVMLRRAIDSIAPDQQQIVILKCFAGLTHDQIGAVLEVPAKTVATRYRRLLDKLKERLKDKI